MYDSVDVARAAIKVAITPSRQAEEIVILKLGDKGTNPSIASALPILIPLTMKVTFLPVMVFAMSSVIVAHSSIVCPQQPGQKYGFPGFLPPDSSALPLSHRLFCNYRKAC